MNCEHVEDLLPAYAEGDLPAEERAGVDTHVEGCASCRQSLEFFTRLEASLVRRRELVPSSPATSRRIVRRLGLRPRQIIPPELVGLPGLIAVALIVLGAASLVFRRTVVEFVEGHENVGFEWSVLLERWVGSVGALTAGSEWALLAVYLGTFALIALTGSWMVLRFVHD